MHIDCFLQRPVLSDHEASVGVLTQHRVLAPPPSTPLLLFWIKEASDVAAGVVLHHFLLNRNSKIIESLISTFLKPLVCYIPIRKGKSLLGQLKIETMIYDSMIYE